MKRSLVILILMYSLSLSVYAKCGNNQTVFSCDTKKGKHIEVCDNKKTIEYSFGKIGAKPELLINGMESVEVKVIALISQMITLFIMSIGVLIR